MKISLKHVFWAAVSFLGLIVFNFLLITLFSGSASYALEQMLKLKFFILPLALGFSLQVLLVLKIRDAMKNSMLVVSATGAVSTGTMIACCAHHVTEVLPFLALGGSSVFLINYQKELLFVSIVINWLGALYMFKKLRRLNGK